jgi:hypothetical protein
MITNKNKINFIKYGLLFLLLVGIVLSVNNLLKIHESFIGGERPGLIIVNNFDYSGTVNDTTRDPELNNNFMYNKENETIYNLKRTLNRINKNV